MSPQHGGVRSTLLSPELVPRVHYPVTRSIRTAMIRYLHHL
jgi:hypothetical protein